MRRRDRRRPFPPKRSASLGLCAVLLALAGALVPPALAFARPQASPAPEPPPEIDTQRLAARTAGLAEQEEKGELPPASAQELAMLRETQQFLEQGTAALAAADRFAGEARSAPEQTSQIEAYLAAPADELAVQIDRTQPLEELNAQLEAARVRLQTERDLRAKVDSDEQYRATRRTEIPAERARATERLDALEAELATRPDAGDPEGLAVARRWRVMAEQYFHRATLRALDEELRSYDARRALLDRRRAYRERRIAVETRNVTSLQETIAARQVELAEATEREAERQRRAAAASHPIVQSILDESKGITARNTEILGLKGTGGTERAEAEGLLESWRTAFERSRARAERAGLTNAIGLHLRNQRSRLPDPNDLRRRMADRDEQISALVNEAEDWSLALDRLAEVDDEVRRRLAAYEQPLPDDAGAIEEIRLAARDALLQQREYLATLTASINDYLDNTLIELQNAEGELRDLVVEYTDYIDQRILWIRSAEPIGLEDLAASGRAALSLLDREAWQTVLSRAGRDMAGHVAIYGICVPLLVALVAVQPLLRRRLQSIAGETRRYTTDRFSLTAAALLITVLMAAAAPAPMMFIGWRLSFAPLGEHLATGLAVGLLQAAELLFAAELIRILCRPAGVGDAHFRWREGTLRTIRRHLRWLVPLVVPLTFIAGVTSPNDNHYDSLGRFAFIGAMIAFAVFLQRLFRPSAGVLRFFIAQHRGGWLDRLRYVWFPLLVLAPLGIAAVAGLGYLYSASQVEQRVWDTTWLLLLVFVGRSALLRGLFIAQRRLDLEQRRKKRAAQAEEAEKASAKKPTAAGEGATEGSAEAQSIAEEQEVNVAAISAQTRQLLNTTVVFAMLIGLAVVWREMLPALSFFQEIKLWTSESATAVAVTADGSGADQAAAAVQREPSTITLAHAIYALLILLVTALVSKNIPGLLEIALLQRLPISPSVRYAISTIARYVLVIVGVVVAFGAIGIGWSKVQWLAAAITVGLGFGLQEIFANFVSGLIILFERPVRVGDTVTVGGITGTVSRLRIRATTIVDWDRKELIIPNKEFVTGQIVNWTLSDPILRIVIPVGIAYGSDTKLAEELLLQVARDDPVVLKDPMPSVVFGEFGESSLNLALRVFIPSIDELLTTRHRLHNAIDQAFRKAGVVIAFPQRDVHIHQVSS